MSDGRPASGTTGGGYAAAVNARLRIARAAGRMRAGGIQVTWLVVVLAGAAVPLAQALDAPGWTGPVLGFVVVIAAGLERIFQRTTDAALALQTLRRSLEREQRLLMAPAQGTPDERLAGFAQRCEEAFRRYDDRMEEYQQKMLD